MRVLILDQFSEPSPYQLQRTPEPFDALVARKLAEPPDAFNAARVEEVDEGWRPPWATTAFREGADGMAEVWKCRWDSSG